MLTLLVGTPGSGKTLYAIDKVIKIANNESIEFKNIEYVYTNISGFDYDKFKENKVTFDRFVFDSFYVHLKLLYSLFIQNEHKDNLDDILQNYCKEHKILNAYFIIDEAHNFFDNQDKIKMWWFTYHRHLNHEILLITQNKSLINTQYRNIPEIFVKAQPRSKAMSKNVLRYFNYTEYRMTQKFSTTEITINDTYFDLYTSGNKSNQKLVGLKFIGMFIIFILIFITFFSLFIYRMYFNNSGPVKEEQKKEEIKHDVSPAPAVEIMTNNVSNINNTPVEIKENEEKLKLFKFNCFDRFCYYKIDNKTNLEIPSNILKTYLLNIDIDKKFTEILNDRLVIYVLVNEDKFQFLTKEVRNDTQQINPNVFDLANLNK